MKTLLERLKDCDDGQEGCEPVTRIEGLTLSEVQYLASLVEKDQQK